MNRKAAIVVGIVAASVIAATGGLVAYRAVPDLSSAGSIGGSFALIDGSGGTVTDRSFPGKWELIYFGYTYCPDACPTTLNTIAETLTALGPLAERVQPLFITVDPERDTPQVMADYVRNFDPRIVGLTGSPEAIAAVAAEYKVYYAVHKTGDGADDYLMDHSGFVYLMNPEGKFARVLSSDGSGKALADRLRPFLSPIS
jgi:protein SCO1